eukprot:CAMPEP_0170176118 /NCGR_PEP_ID=MMETSP0040_2-20121228/9065_1 /TAXON_ID=641309 /ORGANISM="Lotharella oceanica, Strain CCMP622" /LENGTH=68 /DNA_ID=CAMNT_0010418339 /DNA_START=125 /DNA_END=330 /DNA_ORIENTATION=-
MTKQMRVAAVPVVRDGSSGGPASASDSLFGGPFCGGGGGPASGGSATTMLPRDEDGEGARGDDAGGFI